MSIIKEKIEQVLQAELEGKRIIDSGYKQADTILLKAGEKVREIEENLMNQADEITAQARSRIHAETSKILQEMERKTQEEIRLVREAGQKNIFSAVSGIMNKILAK